LFRNFSYPPHSHLGPILRTLSSPWNSPHPLISPPLSPVCSSTVHAALAFPLSEMPAGLLFRSHNSLSNSPVLFFPSYLQFNSSRETMSLTLRTGAEGFADRLELLFSAIISQLLSLLTIFPPFSSYMTNSIHFFMFAVKHRPSFPRNTICCKVSLPV